MAKRSGRKAATTEVKQQFELDGEEGKIKVALALPFHLPLEAVDRVLAGLVEAIDEERTEHARIVGQEKQLGWRDDDLVTVSGGRMRDGNGRGGV